MGISGVQVVSERFEKFLSNITLTKQQIEDGRLNTKG